MDESNSFDKLPVTTAPASEPSPTLCARCAADPQPSNFGNPRGCAFDANGRFTPDNWNCATLEALFGLSLADAFTSRRGDETIDLVPTLLDGEACERHEDSDDLDTGGWFVFTRYKNRGRTSSAVHVGDFWPPARVTLAKVLASLEYYEGQAPVSES